MSSKSSNDYTIVKIKRKRDEDSPDVLVVEPSLRRGFKKPRKSELNVFERLETVDCNAWDEDALKERIKGLTKNAGESLKRRSSDDTKTSPGSMSRRSSQGQARQYRVVSGESKTSNMLPKVRSSKVAGPSFKIFDAVIESNEAEKHTDLEMEKFEHLLRDYLTINEIGPPADTSSKAAKAASADDYVYDIFYYRPSTASEFVSASAVATVTGLPPNSDDEGFSSESEDEDEADEDSNAEDFYKNDYPDEESSEESQDSGDMFHDSPEDKDDGDF